MAKRQKPKKGLSKEAPIPKVSTKSLSNQPAFFRDTRLHCIVILVLSFFLYGNTLLHDFAQDDAIVITDNEFTKKGIAGIPDILKYDTFRGFFKVDGKESLVTGGRYRPLSLVMFATGVSFFGENPFIGHLMNILLYGLTGIVLYLLLLKMLAPKQHNIQAVFIALVTTVLFMVHPIHTEVVANIKGRDEILTLLGSLAALYYSLRAFYENKPAYTVIATLVFFLGLLSKENAAMFIFIVPLTYYFFTKADTATIIKQTAPFIGATVLFILIRSFGVGIPLIGGEAPKELMNNPYMVITNDSVFPASYAYMASGEKMATIFYTLGKYIQLLFAPITLTHDYYPRHVEVMNWTNWQVILSLLIHVALGIYALLRALKKDPLAYGILFYLLSLSIVSNIFFAVGTNMAERFMFMPSVGFCFIVAILGYRLIRMKKGKELVNIKALYPMFVIVGVISLLFSAKTIHRNAAWKSNFTLFSTDIHTSKNSAKLRNSMGGDLVTLSAKEQNEQKRTAMLTEAVGHLNEAVKIHPNYKNAYLLLGNANNYLKQYEASISNYNKALRLDPYYQDAKNNLGITYRDAGRYYGEQKGDIEKSIQYLKKAFEARPTEYETVRLLGVAHGMKREMNKAVEYFKKATEIEPNNADAFLNLGNAYMNAGNESEGTKYRQRAFQMDPDVEKKRAR